MDTNFLTTLLFLLICSTLTAQTKDKPTIYRTSERSFTLNVPSRRPIGVPLETYRKWQETMEAELRAVRLDFEKQANKQIVRLHQYFRVISNINKPMRLREAAQRRLLAMFKDQNGNPRKSVNYLGFKLNEDKAFYPQPTDLEAYIDHLFSVVNEQESFNICWGTLDDKSLESDSSYIIFEPGATNTVLDTNGNKMNLYYTTYSARLPINEGVSYVIDGRGYTKEVCKQITVQLRMVQDKYPDSDEIYDQVRWMVSLENFTTLDDKDCRKVPRVDCVIDTTTIQIAQNDTTTTPPPPPPPMEMDCKKFAPAISYLIPGYAHKLATNDRKKKIRLWPLFAGITAISGGYAGYQKIRSNQNYQDHLNASKLAELDDKFDTAQSQHEDWLLFGGIAVGTFITANAIAYWVDQRGYNECKKTRKAQKASGRTSLLTGEQLPVNTMMKQSYYSVTPSITLLPQSPPAPGLTYQLNF